MTGMVRDAAVAASADVDAAGTVAQSSASSYLHGDARPEPRRGNARDAAALEALHLDAADALLRRHGRAASPKRKPKAKRATRMGCPFYFK